MNPPDNDTDDSAPAEPATPVRMESGMDGDGGAAPGSPRTNNVPWTVPDAVFSVILLSAFAALIIAGIVFLAFVTDVRGRFALIVALLLTSSLQLLMPLVVWYFAVRLRGGTWRQLGIRRLPPVRLAVTALLTLMAAYALVLIYTIVVTVLNLPFLTPKSPPSDIIDDRVTLIILAVMAVAVAPVAEELFFRGFLFQALHRRMGTWRAAGISSTLFGVAHLSLGLIVPTALLGLLLVYAFRRTGSLWSSIAVHSGFNAISVTALAASS